MKKLAAVALAAALSPLAQAETIVALRDSTLDLISFDSADPATITGRVGLKGLGSLEFPLAMDFRPSDEKIYLVTVDFGELTDDEDNPEPTCRLYTVAPSTGQLSVVGSANFLCPNPPTDMDFDPKENVIRVVSGRKNYRLSPSTGAIIGDGEEDVVYNSGTGLPDIIGLAYFNNVSPAPTNRTLYAIDSTSDFLVRIGDSDEDGTSELANNSVNEGKVYKLFALKDDIKGTVLKFDPLSSGEDIASEDGIAAQFDISGASPYTAYLLRFNNVSMRSELYTINLSNGAPTRAGVLGGATRQVLGMTVVPASVTLPNTSSETPEESGGAAGAGLLLGLATFGLWRQRRRSA